MTAAPPERALDQVAQPFARGSGDTIGASSGNRIGWVDYAKGICIILVVCGHVLGGMGAAGLLGRPAWRTYINSFLYSFRVPTFFIIAGIFLGRSVVKPTRILVTSKLRVLGYPYLLWSGILIGLHQLFRGYANWAPDAEGSLTALAYRPYGHLWFIYALLAASILFILAFKASHRRSALIALSIGLYVAVPALHRLNWDVPATIAWYFPYLTLGYLLGPSLVKKLPAGSPWLLCSVATMAFTVLAILAAVISYQSPWSAPILAILGAAGVISTSGFLAGAGRIGVIRYVGARSLPIYLAHVLGTAGARILLHKVLHVKPLFLIFATGLVGGIGIPFALAWLADTIGFPYLFTLGVARSPSRARLVRN